MTRVVAAVIIAAALAGCGGGNSDDVSDDQKGLNVLRVDAAMEQIQYLCDEALGAPPGEYKRSRDAATDGVYDLIEASEQQSEYRDDLEAAGRLLEGCDSELAAQVDDALD